MVVSEICQDITIYVLSLCPATGVELQLRGYVIRRCGGSLCLDFWQDAALGTEEPSAHFERILTCVSLCGVQYLETFVLLFCILVAVESDFRCSTPVG